MKLTLFISVVVLLQTHALLGEAKAVHQGISPLIIEYEEEIISDIELLIQDIFETRRPLDSEW